MAPVGGSLSSGKRSAGKAGKGGAGKNGVGKGGAGKGRRGRAVLAAGAVLWLPAVSGGAAGDPAQPRFAFFQPLIALIHRPKYGDWSLPKGKLEPGEEAAAAAVREVWEETGLECRLGAPLPAIRYTVQGRAKEVRYWAAVPTGGVFTPNREVDRLAWLPAPAARARLTHDRDRVLVDALLGLLGLVAAGEATPAH